MKLNMMKKSREPVKAPLPTPSAEAGADLSGDGSFWNQAVNPDAEEVDLYPLVPPAPASSEILMTESAAMQIQKIIESENSSANGIRAGVQGGGCSGLTYKIDLENEPQEGDRVFDGPIGMKLYVDKKSFLFLVGTVLDWSGGLNGKGFQFANPNATATCGCGESFAV